MSAVQQLIAFVVLAVVIVAATTYLVALGKLDAAAFTAIVGGIAGGLIGILNPVPPKPAKPVGEP